MTPGIDADSSGSVHCAARPGPVPGGDSFHPDMIAVTKNRITNQYLAAAARLGLEARPLFDDRRTWLIEGRGRRVTVRAAILGCNNPLAVRFSADKHLTHLLMAGHDVSMPAYKRFFAVGGRAWRMATAAAIEWAKGRYPVVVKGSTGSGAKNVHVDIDSDDEFCDDITDPVRAHQDAFNEVNSAPTPAEFVPGMSEARYLVTATAVLSRYFGIERAGQAV